MGTKLTSCVIAKKGDTNVNQVVQPTWHNRLAVFGDYRDELGLEELVAVEEDIVSVPSSGCGDQTRAEVCKSEFERLSIVSSNLGLLLRSH